MNSNNHTISVSERNLEFYQSLGFLSAKDVLAERGPRPLELFKTMLRPISASPLKRYGPSHDGGYVIANEILSSSDKVYSYGVGLHPHECQFDLELAAIGKTLFLYDGTINQPPLNHPNFVFKRENVNSTRILSHLKDNGDFNQTNLTLKMDIEGAEYETLINCEEIVLGHFSQIIIEIHDILDSLTRASFGLPLDEIDLFCLLRRLLIHFEIAHVHANNYGKVLEEIPDVMELLLIRKDHVVASTISPSPFSFPIAGLDFPNDPNQKDISLTWWEQ